MIAAELPPGWRAALGVLCLALAIPGTPATDRRTAVEVSPRTAAERALVESLASDVWTQQPEVVVLSRAGIAALAARGIPYRITVADIDAVAAAEHARLATRSTESWFADYRDLDEVTAHMDQLAARAPAIASVRTLGTSIEGRPIRAISISRGGKLGIAMNGAQHAREWISAMVPICIADRLVANQDEPRVRRLLDAVHFEIVPVANPDGYAYSWTDDRYWRKNRRGGFGVDINRNYGVAWGESGSSADRTSPTYRGEQAFSEPETRALSALFDDRSIRAHVDFHSFSQVILYPWSHQKAPPADRDRFAAIADRMASAIFAAHGERYAIRAGADLATGIGGTLGDWAYGERGVLSFLVELRPASSRDGGFVIPPEQIVPACDESFAAVLELAEQMSAR